MRRRKASLPAQSEVFGSLTVIGDAVSGKLGNYLPCMCECGTPVFVTWSRLNNSGTTTCGTGCRPKVTIERLYSIWSNMKDRCQNPRTPSYSNYGGRGITVCGEWQVYKDFRAWALGAGYEDDLTLERVDNNDGYYPGNCKWLPKPEQSRNRRSSVWITYHGERKILVDWADDPRCVVGYHTLYNRLRTGWPFEAALTHPRNSRKPQASD